MCRSPPCHDSTRRPCRPAARPRRPRRPRARGHGRPTRAASRRSGRSARRRRRQGFRAVSPKNIVVAAARTRPERCGCSNASSRHSQSSAACEANTSESPVYTAGMPRRPARRGQARASLWPRRSPRRRRARAARPSNVAPLASSAPMSAARSAAMWSRRSSIGRCAVAWAERLPGHHPQPERVVVRAPAAGALVMRVDRAGPRCLVAELRRRAAPPAACRPAAASLRQLVPRVPLVPAVSAASQVGDDVAAAERVDRLLRVADQDQRGVPAEGAVDHLPLHRIGVLELVDHHDRPARCIRARAGESSASSASASRVSRSS